jgi:WD40 repeat protein
MSDNFDKMSDSLTPYTSAASMKEAHGKLIKRYNLNRQGNGNTDPDLWRDVEEFIKRGRLTGMLLDDYSERWTAQSNLEFWSSTLFREQYSKGGAPPNAVLLDFNPELAPKIEDTDCPYLGLDSFRDSKFFFGRQRLLQSLLDKLENSRLLALIGESGSGKSSLAMGGLLPALKAGKLPKSQTWHYFKPMVPGSNPFLALRRAIESSDATDQPRSEIDLKEFLKDATYLSRVIKTRFNRSTVLLVDQFEEVFTLCEDVQLRHAFINSIFHLTQTRDHNHLVILTMRSDYKSSVNDLPQPLKDFTDAFNNTQVPVTAPDSIELREAITKPAEIVGLKFEKEVVDALVQDIVGETAPLPLLQFTLLKLWEGRSRNLVTMETYKGLGRGRRALELSAEALYDKLSPAQQITLQRILLRMVKPTEGLEFTSNRVLYDSLFYKSEAPERVKTVLDKLIENRLVRLTENDAGDVQVEIAHEALVRYWPRLVKWLGDVRADMAVRQRLEAKAAEWIRLGKGAAGLLDAVQLREAQRWLESAEATTLGFNPSLQELVDASQKAIELAESEKEAARQREAKQYQALAKEQEQRALAESQRAEAESQRADAEQQRAVAEAKRAEDAAQAGSRWRSLLYLTIGVAVVTLVFAFFAWQERRRAFGEKERADKQTLVAQSNQLAAQSLSYLRDQPDLSLLLSAQANLIDPTNAEARNSLVRGLEFSSTIKSFLSGHKYAVRTLAFPSNNDLVTADEKGNLIRWDAEKRVKTSSVKAPPDLVDVSVVATSPNGKALVLRGKGKFFLWLPDSSSPVQTLSEGLTNQATFAFSPDSKTLAILGDNNISLHNVIDNSVRVLVTGNKSDPFYYIAPVFSPDGKTLAAIELNTPNVFLWNLATGQRRQLKTPEEVLQDSMKSIAFSPDSKLLISGGERGTIVLWNLESGHSISSDLPVSSNVSSLVFNPMFTPKSKGNISYNDFISHNDFASGDEQGNIITWQIIYNNLKATSKAEGIYLMPLKLATYADKISTLAFSPDGNTLASGSSDSSVILWSVMSDRSDWFSQLLTGHDGPINSITISSDGKTLASGDSNGNIILWDLDQRRFRKKLTGEQEGISDEQRRDVYCLAFSPDGKTLVSGSDNEKITLWDVANNQQLKSFQAHSNFTRSVAFSPDGQTLASSGGDKKICLWNVTTGERIKEMPNPLGDILSIAFSPDGKTLATGGEDAKVRLWNIASGQEIDSHAEHSERIESVVFSPDGKTLASGSDDETIVLWDISASPTVKRRLTGHTDIVSSLVYSKSGDILASGSWDGTVIVWNTGTRQQAYQLTGLTITADKRKRRTEPAINVERDRSPRNRNLSRSVRSIALTPDGKTLVAGRSGRAINLWDISYEAWIARACRIANRNFRPDEWAKFMPDRQYQRTCPNLPPGE